MEQINIPKDFGNVVDARFYSPNNPMVIFASDNHFSRRAQVNIAKTYVDLTTEYGLKLVGLEGFEAGQIVFSTPRGLPTETKYHWYTTLDGITGYVPYGFLIKETARRLGLETEGFGYTDMKLREQLMALTELQSLLATEARENILKSLSTENRQNTDNLISKRVQTTNYFCARFGAANLLKRLHQRRERLALIGMGFGHAEGFVRYMTELYQAELRVNYQIFEPIGLHDESDKEAEQEYLKEMRAEGLLPILDKLKELESR